jgi:hypothetical protein
MKTFLISILMAASAATTCLAGPTITVSAAPTTITNQGDEATYTLTLSTPTSKKIQVNFQMTGTATLNSDYFLLGNFNDFGQIVIPAGQSSAMVTLHTQDDDGARRSETAIFNLIGGDAYRVGRPNRATITILNDRYLQR